MYDLSLTASQHALPLLYCETTLPLHTAIACRRPLIHLHTFLSPEECSAASFVFS